MKIRLATSWKFPHVGGVSTHMTLLARAFGIDETEILNFDQVVQQHESLVERICRATLNRARGETITAHSERMVNLLRGVDCDLLHCHDAMATWAAGIARRRFGKPYRIVSTVHGPVSRHMVEHGSGERSAEVIAVEKCERAAWQLADQIISVDKTQKEICLEQGADPARITVIANAVDVNEIDEKLKLLRLVKDANIDWILVPRRLVPKNGVGFAIEAMNLLPQRVRLMIAGDGIDEARCRRLVVERGLGGRVAFLGGVPRDVVLMLSSLASATLIPSVPANGIVEATSIAAIEAMACRVPVVASAIGGLVELIEDKRTGLLVPPGDPVALANAIQNILGERVPVPLMVNQARSIAVRQFSLPVWAAAVTDVYKRAMTSPLRCES